jgi:DNA-binding GntR family transcriptional regulator
MNQLLRVPREETSLRQRATHSLRRAILGGVFTPGQKLSERQLCESLDVSRSCVRESLQHLQAEGLITIVPHRGPEVTTISAQEVKEIYEVRSYLESLAGAGFTRNASPVHVQALRAKLRELERPEVGSDRETMLDLKNQFYDILIEGCGNAIAGQMLQQLTNRVTVLRRISMAAPGRFAQTLAELNAIVVAVESGDADTAARLCGEHVKRAAENVLRNMPSAKGV